MQNSVLIAIFTTLLTKRGITREYLSQKFELSTRTITRYIDVLCASGIPIESRKGASGGYFIADDYKIDKMLFAKGDVKRIINVLYATNSFYNDTLNDQIITTLKDVYRHYNIALSSELDSNFAIDSVPHCDNSAIIDNFNAMVKAIRQSRRVSIVFNHDDKNLNIKANTPIELDPYNIAFKKNVWYFFAFCQANQLYNIYPFLDIQNLMISPRTFARRHDCSIYDFLLPTIEPTSHLSIEYDFACTIKNLMTQERFSSSRQSAISRNLINKTKTEVVAKFLSYGYSEKISSPKFIKKEITSECRKILEIF